ncbi:MAG: DUF2961 domain-containing protein [Bacteroidales bacterium]|nr:DUF2961 domain-containing protein [Candidatus Sodaliphilus aphodohippi]
MRKNFNLMPLAILFIAIAAVGCQGTKISSFNGIDTNLGTLSLISNAESRCISPENFTGARGKGALAVPSNPKQRNVNNASKAASELGQGWKVNPYVHIAAGETFTLAEMEGPGAVKHFWITTLEDSVWRSLILRIYWDDEKTPSVECPLGDFFCQGWNKYAHVSSIPICVNPRQGFNSFWSMPFRKKCRMTLENCDIYGDELTVYYEVDYVLTDVPRDAAYFHAQFRRNKLNETSDHVILDGVKGQGQYVGTYLAWKVHNGGWWGEGEAKFFLDGDSKSPTICSTGLEDYILGSHNFDSDNGYVVFTGPYSGCCQAICPNGSYHTGDKFGLYRWHIADPVRFKSSLKVTIQDLGWKRGGIYNAQKSDVSSTAFWYQTEPHAPFPPLPSPTILSVDED